MNTKSWQRPQPLILECSVCGKQFEHWNYRDTVTCGKECATKLMVERRREEGTYKRTEGAINKSLKTRFGKRYRRRYRLKCPICGVVFEVKASERKTRRTCGRQCMGVYQSNKNRGRKMSQAQRKLISKRRKERGLSRGENNPNYGKGCHHPTGRGCGGYRKDIGHFVRSKPEANYSRILQYEGIEYRYEHRRFKIVRADGTEQTFCPDFYLVKEDKYVEIKGYEKPDSMVKYACFVEQYPEINVEMIKTQSEKWKSLKRQYDRIVNWEK